MSRSAAKYMIWGDEIVEMTYAETADRVSGDIHKFKDEPGPDGMVRTAEEMFGQARELGAHTARYARIAYRLDMLFLFFAVLFFSLVLLIGVFEDRLPPEAVQAIGSSLDAIGLEAFLFLLLGPVILPAAFYIIFAVVCKRAPVRPVKEAEAGMSQKTDSVPEKMRRVEELLRKAERELDPGDGFSVITGRVLCVLFMIPMTVVIIHSVMGMRVQSFTDYNVALFTGVMMFLMFAGVFQLLLWLKLRVLVLVFSNRKLRKELKKLCGEFTLNMFKYQKRFEEEERRRREEEEERQRLADLEEGAELYKKAVQGGTVDDNLMILAAEKGDPRASLYIGEQIIMCVQDSGLTAREIKEFYEDARDYFEVAADAGFPDGIFWHAAAQVITESHDERGWMEILRRVRALNKAALSQACVNVYDMVVEQLVDLANDAAARADAHRRRQQAEDAALMREIMDRRCRYSDGSYCTRKSTASFLYPCTGDGKGRNFCVEYAK